MTERQKVTFTHLIGTVQHRRETWVTKVFKNGNFKIYGSNTIWSLESCGQLARASGAKAQVVSPYIVIEV